jgi:beta-lactam-binding protein with PASTA domain/lysophospholipase L1-like esterase
MAAPTMVSPLDGSTLSGSSETFTWTADGESVDRWRLEVGTAPDDVDLFVQSFGSTTTSTTVSGLPTDGSLLYVSLKSRTSGVVSTVSFTYTAFDDSVPPTNVAPVVDAGGDQSTVLPADTITLTGVATDDGLPLGTLNLIWSTVSGPGAVTFMDPTAASTTANFVTPGDYVLQLNASDTILDTSDQMLVTVHAAAVLTSIQVTPAPAVLLAADTQQFVATGLDQVGQAFAIAPLWAATGGTIDSSGFYTAGSVTGQFLATASAEGVDGSADIFVVDDLGPWPTNGWDTATPAEMEMDQSLLEQARDYALTTGGSGMITRHGREVLSWGNTTSTSDVKSVTKSFGAMMLGLAIKDNLVVPTDLAQTHYPAIGANPASNVDTGWLDEITLLNLATHTGGFDKASGYGDLLFQPGTTWAYSDGGVNWLADTLTVTYQADLLPILRDRISTPLGIPTAELDWSDSLHRDLLVEGLPRREFNSSISISADAMARMGYLVLRNGHWDGQNIILPEWVDQMRTTVPGVVGLPVGNDLDSKYAGASDHYGIGWWNNLDVTLPNVPSDAYWGWGINDHLILVIPSLDIVVSRTGGTPWAGVRTPSYYQVLAPFFDPIVQSVTSFGNEAPTVDAGSGGIITLPTDTVNLDGTVSDDGFPDGTLDVSWTLFSGPASVTFGDSLQEDTTATFTIAGDYTLRLSATDGFLSTSDDVLITVLLEPDTELPVVTVTEPADAATVDGDVTVAATATDNIGVIEVEFFVGGSSIGIDSTAPYTAIWNSTAQVDADYDITAIGRDASGNEGSGSVMVTLDNAAAVNLPPTADAGADAGITLPMDTISLIGTATDDGLPSGNLTTTWTAVVAPFAVTFIDDTALATDATFGGAGTYVLRLIADDGSLSTSADVTITVNSAPPTGDQSFVATGDSLINANNGGRNYGTNPDVVIHSFGPKVGLVQFDLASLSGATVNSASFLFRLNSLKSDGDIDIQVIDEAWSEDTVSFDTEPAFGATVVTVPVTSADVGTVISVDVTSVAQSWADGSQPSHGLRLQTGQNINAFIDSLESGGTPMELLVSSGPVLVTVPAVSGLTQASAEATIVAANLAVGTITNQNDAVVPAGDVISQSPIDGTEVTSGSTVDLVVSLGPVQVTVPDVVASTQASAEAVIVAANLIVGAVTFQNDLVVPMGDVVSQNPVAGADVDAGSSVDLAVSLGPAMVPGAVGMTQVNAEAAILAANLIIGSVTFQNDAVIPIGEVISQNPIGGTAVASGTAVDLVVSLGPLLAPDVVGLTQANAEATIVLANLVVGAVTSQSDTVVPAGDVISQNPVGGTSMTIGSAVDLVVSLGPAPTTVPDVVGSTQVDAEASIIVANLVVGTVTQQNDLVIPVGEVISQSPTGGIEVPSSSAVDLVVSLGPATAPDVVGLTQVDAEAAIVAANLLTGTVTFQNDLVVPADDVISQDPVGGTSLGSDATVDLVVSLGPELEPPTVTVLSPENGATLTGWIRISADAADNFEISSVSFEVDGTEVQNLTAPPYEFDWDSNTLANGTYELLVTATDSSNNQTSVMSTIYVDALSTQPSIYPASPVITGLQWAPSAAIAHDAVESDNWPITWADDGDLYTAYGDGWGFALPDPDRLSLGYAKVTGPATAFTGTNIPSPSGEEVGDGSTGKKASGILMVDGVLYQWVRNANNNGEQCELAWSSDHGDTWTWNDWQFAELGYCAFLNFGQNYLGARDSYVYMYSADTPSAYNETDNLVLTRVPKDKIADRNAYEFFAGLDGSSDPVWSTDISLRQPVFTLAGGVNRTDVTYQPTLGRYLMTMRSRARNGGLNQFSIYEGKEPWGPWSVVYFTESWEGAVADSDADGWGEAQHIPSKWMSADGQEFYLVFSGDDSFAVRHAGLTVVPDTTPPVVNVTSPLDAEAIAGAVTVTAVASDDYAIQSVQFDVDGMFIGEIFYPPYALDWDSSGVATGDRVITALATDTSNNQSSSFITVSVFRDTTLPTVTLDAPADGSTVAGTTTIAATANDDLAVASVSFSIDAGQVATLTTGPFDFSWDTTTYANGDYEVTATAVDTSGNSAIALANVTVLNVNVPPLVDAGVSQAITLPTDTVSLSGTVSDDGLPGAGVTTSWTMSSGPAAVQFADATSAVTTATFTVDGEYVLHLSADDGEFIGGADITVTVDPEPVAVEQTFVAGGDSLINGRNTSRNFGSNVDILVHSYGPKVGLVQFDLSSLSGAVISSASLRFSLNALRSDGDINLQLIEEAWSENTVTYDDQPAMGAAVLSVPVTAADVGTIVSVDVTGIVQDWADGAQPSHGFGLETGQSINASIDSLESGGTPMELIVTTGGTSNSVATPTISPDGATSASPVEVTLATSTVGASINYTLDGSTPTTNSMLYAAPFTLAVSATVNARAFATGLSDSAVSSAIFDIDSAIGGDLNNYWTLNESVTGIYANDIAGTAGACTNCPTPVGGRVDTGQAFDGVDDVITIADDGSADWSQSGGFSIEFWVNKSTACSAREVIIGRYDSGALMQWSAGCESGVPFFELADTNGTSVTVAGSSSIDDGTWHHVVAIYDGFFNENRLYVDGNLDASGATAYTAGFDSSADVTIGVLQNGLSDSYFDGIVDEVAFHDRAIPTSMISLHQQDGTIGLRDGYLGCSTQVDLMPLGDSITNALGYRQTLYFDLESQGFDMNFVGSRSDNVSTGSHDRDHEGWSGFATTNIAPSLNGWLTTNPPDVILLHIGTNDVDTVSVAEAITGLTSVLDIVHAFDPEITVVLGQIIIRETFEQATMDYNDQMATLAQTRIAAGHKILVVDHENALTYPDDMADSEHPNTAGYAKMASVWFDGLINFLPACVAAAPSIQSQAPTSGQVATEYRYEPTVLANPTARFALLSAPAGMLVHPDTGEIRWTPALAGQHQVDLQVENSEGSSVQSFVLDVP